MQSTLNLAKENWEKMLGALANRNRLLIINELLKKESSVNNLSSALSIKTYNISKHLRILEDSGLVIKRKYGINRIYKISENLHSYSSQTKRVLDLGCCKFKFTS